MVWIGVPPALSNRLWARLRARNAISSCIVFSKSARCSSVKGCTYLTIITSSGRGEYATKSGLTLMRYCISIVSKNFWSGTYQCQRASQRRPLAPAALHQLRWLFPRDPRHALAWQARGAREAGVGGGRAGGGLGHPRGRPGVRGGPEHGAAVVGRGGGPCHGLFPVLLARRAGHAGPTG